MEFEPETKLGFITKLKINSENFLNKLKNNRLLRISAKAILLITTFLISIVIGLLIFAKDEPQKSSQRAADYQAEFRASREAYLHNLSELRQTRENGLNIVIKDGDLFLVSSKYPYTATLRSLASQNEIVLDQPTRLTFKGNIKYAYVNWERIEEDDGKALTVDIYILLEDGTSWVAESIPVVSPPTFVPPFDFVRAEASWSRDGTKLAYVAGGTFFVDTSTGSRRLLDERGDQVLISPEGQHVYFTTHQLPEGKLPEEGYYSVPHLRRFNVSNEKIETLFFADIELEGDLASLSPNGQYLYVKTGWLDLLVKTDGSLLRRIGLVGEHGEPIAQPALLGWGPPGKAIYRLFYEWNEDSKPIPNAKTDKFFEIDIEIGNEVELSESEALSRIEVEIEPQYNFQNWESF